MDAEDVVVSREHVHGLSVSRLHLDRNLRVVDAGEVARTGGLVLLGLQRERIRVHTGNGVAGVVVEGLHLVEVLTLLGLEAILTVEHELEGVEGTGGLLSEVDGGTSRTNGKHGRTGEGGGHEAVGRGDGSHVGLENDIVGGVLGGEVPERRARGGVREAEHELLNGVVVGEADLLGLTGGDGVGTSVLHLLDQVLVTLLGEATTLLGVEVDVVGPHLERVGVAVGGEIGGEVDVDAHLVVLKGDEREVETGVAVEEEQEGKVDGAGRGGGHLRVGGLLGLIEVKLGVQAPPLLVVLVDTLTTNGKLDVVDGTLGDEVAVISRVGGDGVGSHRGELDVHVTDEITVTGDGDGHAAGIGGSTVDGLLDVLHREVGVALVFRLKKSYLGVTGKVDILGAVSYELHETTGHCELLYYRQRK